VKLNVLCPNNLHRNSSIHKNDSTINDDQNILSASHRLTFAYPRPTRQQSTGEEYFVPVTEKVLVPGQDGGTQVQD